MDEETRARLDAIEQRAADIPMPRDLRSTVADGIEPHTMNYGIKHGPVLEAIELAYPLILDYLREHPEALRG